MCSTLVGLLLTFTAFVAAQTSTTCNPLTSSCPADPGLSQSSYTANFLNGAASRWGPVAGTTVTYGNQGLQLTVASALQAPVMQTDFFILFGYVEAKIKAAPGVGLVSSLVLLSDDLDEIDWEWLGGRNDVVETNYFGKGNTTTYDRATYPGVDQPITEFHTYGIDWRADSITWSVDGNVVRKLNYADAVGGQNFPQSPCRVSVGLWAGGASSAPGTVKWAGGATDFSQGPFTMYIQSVSVTNYNPADTYSYGDHSGSYQSIQRNGGSAFNAGGSGNSPGSGNVANPVSSNAAAAVSTTVAPVTTTSPPPPPTTTTTTTTTTTSTTTPTTTTTTLATTTTTHTIAATTSSTTIRSSSTITTSSTTITTSRSGQLATSSAPAAQSSSAPGAASTRLDLSWIPSMVVSVLGLVIGTTLI